MLYQLSYLALPLPANKRPAQGPGVT
jgi:hypothetical protein